MSDALYSTREAAEALFLNSIRLEKGEQHIKKADMMRLYRMIDKGQIQAERLGERLYISASEIERLKGHPRRYDWQRRNNHGPDAK